MSFMKIPVQNTQVEYKTPVVYNFLPPIKIRAFSLNTEWFIFYLFFINFPKFELFGFFRNLVWDLPFKGQLFDLSVDIDFLAFRLNPGIFIGTK